MRAHNDALHESLVRSGRLQRRILLDETKKDDYDVKNHRNKGSVVCANDPWICEEEQGRNRNRRLHLRSLSENNNISKTSNQRQTSSRRSVSTFPTTMGRRHKEGRTQDIKLTDQWTIVPWNDVIGNLVGASYSPTIRQIDQNILKTV